MTIQDVFDKYKGQALLVPGADPADSGQCVQAADYFLHEAYGLPYAWLNAIDFWRNPDANLKANFDFIPYSPSMPIKVGDFVIYGTGVGSPYGHISTAGQAGVGNNYLGFDSNWSHNLTLHAQPHNDSYNQFILGILRRKGDNVPMSTIIPDQDNWYARFNKLMVQIRGRTLSRDEFRKNFVGVDDFHMIEILSDNPEADEATAPQAQDIKNFCSAVYKVQADAQDLSYAGKPWHDVMYYLAGKYQTKIEPLGTVSSTTKDSVIKYIQEKLT